MQIANILLALGGDSGNQVPKFGVTAAEIAVLRAIHGEDAVTNVLPLSTKDDRTNRGELARLRARYGAAQDGEGNKVVDTLFPGAAARVFETIDELELPRELFAAKERVSSKPFGGKGDHDGNGTTGGAIPVDLNTLSPAKLKKLAEDEKIDLGEASKKPDIIAAIEAARAAKNGVKTLDDLTDEQLAKLAGDNEVDLDGSTDRAEIIAKLDDAGVSADDLEDDVGVLG
jgi:hypothetical protein